MWQEDQLPAEQNPYGLAHSNWRGAMREYDAQKGRWLVFGPAWHTGQTVKALVLAHRVLGESWLLDGARRAAAFLMRERVSDHNDPDFGLIHAPEGAGPNGVNEPNHETVTSGILETLDGLMLLSDETGDGTYGQAALDALRWVERKTFLREEGLFLDLYDPHARIARSLPGMTQRPNPLPGRPLLDDGVFLKGFQRTGDTRMRDVFYRTAERLLRDENPPGNFILYTPSNYLRDRHHPRHAYWWGRPMVMAWKDSGDRRFLECARRAGRWYVNAQRLDGGFFRKTDSKFKTASFGHATSGILYAAALWHDLMVEGEGDEFREPLRLALSFGLRMQFTRPRDENLRGAILEKVLPPEGTDRPPFMIRDVGTFAYVQALCLALMDGCLEARLS